MTFGTALPVALIGCAIARQFVNPAAHRSVVIATGHPDGACHLFARQYREILARNGIELQTRTTAGSIENLALLQDEEGNASLAFVQGGSGMHAIGSMLLADNFIDTGSGDTQAIAADSAARELLQDEVDALFMVAGPEGRLQQQLLQRLDVLEDDWSKVSVPPPVPMALQSAAAYRAGTRAAVKLPRMDFQCSRQRVTAHPGSCMHKLRSIMPALAAWPASDYDNRQQPAAAMQTIIPRRAP
jgi:hypothetical protein